MKGTGEACVVAEVAWFAYYVGSGEKSTDIGTCGGRVSGSFVQIALLVYKIAAVGGVLRSVIVARFVGSNVVSLEFDTLLYCINRGPKKNTINSCRKFDQKIKKT